MADPFAEDLVALLPRLRRYAIVLCRARDGADDLVQVACERALANRHQFKPGTRMDAWTMRILRNAWIDLARRSKARGETVSEDVNALVAIGADAAATDRLDLADTVRAIATLPPDAQEVLLLVSAEGLTYGAAAQVLGVPVGTVMSRLSRAREKLRTILE